MHMRFARLWRQNLIAVFLLGTAALPAYALNDNYVDAIAISTLPFSDAEITSTATTEATDPASICFVGAGNSPATNRRPCCLFIGIPPVRAPYQRTAAPCPVPSRAWPVHRREAAAPSPCVPPFGQDVGINTHRRPRRRTS